MTAPPSIMRTGPLLVPIMDRPAITRPATTRHPEGVRSTITPRRSVMG
jgi:hypothetical protein